jgi:hypothetical protein
MAENEVVKVGDRVGLTTQANIIFPDVARGMYCGGIVENIENGIAEVRVTNSYYVNVIYLVKSKDGLDSVS